MLKTLSKIFGCLRLGGRGKNKVKKSEQEKHVWPPLTPEEAYRKREARRKRKAQKSARRRNRR